MLSTPPPPTIIVPTDQAIDVRHLVGLLMEGLFYSLYRRAGVKMDQEGNLHVCSWTYSTISRFEALTLVSGALFVFILASILRKKYLIIFV